MGEEKLKLPVVIFENNEAYRKSLELYFQEFPDILVTGAFDDGAEAVERIYTAQPKLILMDIDMPVVNGIDATSSIKAVFPDLAILILTVFEENEKIFDAIKAGADGYLLKSTAPHEIVQAMYDTVAGGSPMTPSIARKILHLFARNKPVDISSTNFQLTDKEKQVLQSLVDGNSYKLIGHNLQISVDTVRFHIRNIYTKLHVNSATEAVSMAIKNRLI
jgi:DNA-binding NarL/FixJ family response regulator